MPFQLVPLIMNLPTYNPWLFILTWPLRNVRPCCILIHFGNLWKRTMMHSVLDLCIDSSFKQLLVTASDRPTPIKVSHSIFISLLPSNQNECVFFFKFLFKTMCGFMNKGPMFSSSPGLPLNWINNLTITIHPHQCFFGGIISPLGEVKERSSKWPKGFFGGKIHQIC